MTSVFDSALNIQYDARDKFFSCLVLDRKTSESPAIVISVRRKSAANLARFAAETLVLCGTVLRAVVSGEFIKKSLSGVNLATGVYYADCS